MGSIETPSAKLHISSPQVEELRAQLKTSKLLTPDSEGYADSIKRWSGAAERPAGAVLLADSESDISTAVVFASKHHLDLAVRCGGHSTSGSSSSNGGLVIDLAPMRGTKVDLEKKTVTAQGGCLWADVDSAASEHGMATPGGTVNHTGIGGLTLGGGYGYLTGLHGMVVDNLVSARVVLASGEIATASQTTNPDLFWALRGAGHNFGVVTSFEYALYPQGDVWCGVMAFTPDKLEPLVNFLNAHYDKHDPLAPCFMFITCPPHITSPMFAAMVFYNGTEEKGKEVYKPLLDLGPVFSTMSLTSYASANGSHNDQMVHGPRRRVRGGSFHMPLSIPFVQHCLAKFQEMVEELPSAGPSILAWEFFDNKKVNEVPIDATAFCNRGDHHNMTIGLTWTGQENDEKVKAWARYFGGEFEKALKTSEGPGESKGHATPIYVNNIESGDMKVKDVFGVNYPKLQKLKGKYDPGLVFDKTHPIQPVFE